MGMWSWLSSQFGGRATRQKKGDQAGVPDSHAVRSPKAVTEDTALQVSAVWACVKLMAEVVSSLPIKVYQVDGRVRTLDEASRLAMLLSHSPNSRQTGMEFMEVVMLNFLMHGNGYARIDRNARGEPIALWPLPAQQMKVELLDDGSLVYVYHEQKNNGLNMAAMAAENVLHIKLFGNGLVGLSPIAHARADIGLELAAQEFASDYYINAGKPSGVLTMDEVLTLDQRATMKTKFKDILEGSQNAHKLLLLEGGMKYQQMQLSPADMEVLEARRFNIESIARFWGVPSILINDNKDTTSWGSGIEQIILGWLSTGLGPLLTKVEQRLTKSLIPIAQRKSTKIFFDIADLLRADTKSRVEFLTKLVINAIMTVNEAREKLGLPVLDVPAADQLTMQINRLPIEEIAKQLMDQSEQAA